MSAVHVTNIESLTEMEVALRRMQGEAGEALRRAWAGVEARIERFAQMEDAAHRAVSLAERDLEMARDELDRCESYVPDEDEYAPDCTGYQYAVSDAGAALREARERLESISVGAARTRDAAVVFHSGVAACREVFEGSIDPACLFLVDRIEELKQYLASTNAGPTT